jgi:hypothetical protein
VPLACSTVTSFMPPLYRGKNSQRPPTPLSDNHPMANPRLTPAFYAWALGIQHSAFSISPLPDFRGCRKCGVAHNISRRR